MSRSKLGYASPAGEVARQNEGKKWVRPRLSLIAASSAEVAGGPLFDGGDNQS